MADTAKGAWQAMSASLLIDAFILFPRSRNACVGIPAFFVRVVGVFTDPPSLQKRTCSALATILHE
jgi:hypothetical protein